MVFLWISDKNTVIKTTERSFKYESSTCFCSGQTDPWVGSSQIGVLREKKKTIWCKKSLIRGGMKKKKISKGWGSIIHPQCTFVLESFSSYTLKFTFILLFFALTCFLKTPLRQHRGFLEPTTVCVFPTRAIPRHRASGKQGWLTATVLPMPEPRLRGGNDLLRVAFQ